MVEMKARKSVSRILLASTLSVCLVTSLAFPGVKAFGDQAGISSQSVEQTDETHNLENTPVEVPKAETAPTEQPSEVPETETIPSEQPGEVPETETTPSEQPGEVPETETIPSEQPGEVPETETIPSEQPGKVPKTETIPSEQPGEVPDLITPPTPANPVWETSKSKTATNLDDSFQSRVTLSLPATETELVSDVVFVLDESSCSAPVKASVHKMLTDLYEQVKNADVVVNIGAVQFRGEVTEFPLSTLNVETADRLTDFMSKRPKEGGSNMSMGLLVGEKMLDNSRTPNERKYLILVSDGITYIWDDEATAEPENFGVNFSNADTPNNPFLASPDGWDVKHSQKFVPADWGTHFDQKLIEKTIAEKSSVYKRGADISGNPFVKPDEQSQYTSSVDIALYKSMLVYRNIASKYHANVVLTGVQGEMDAYPYGPSFMNYLANGKSVSFDQIQKKVFYLLDAGSKVVDTIGFGKDDKGNKYNMDFIPDASKLTLTVGDKALDVTKIDIVDPAFNGSAFETACFGFGTHEKANYDFVLHYFAKGLDGKSDECFVWDINVPISSFAPVQLTYTVKLTNPQSASGTYGQFDADGSEKLPALYTNKKAVLYPVDSNGDQGIPELFAKPTVSYTVSSEPDPDPDKPVNPGIIVDPNPDKPVNPGTIVDPDPDKPVDPGETVGPDPDKPADPSETVDPDSNKPIDSGETVDPDQSAPNPNPENPKTGDTFSLPFYLGLMAVGAMILLGLFFTRKGRH